MFGDQVEKCMQDLDESIECCREWKRICTHTQEMIVKNSSRPGWPLKDDDTIFAENEAFMTRCRDIKDICEGQLQFALKGPNCVMPVFGGTKGQEWTANLIDLQDQFQKQLLKIQKLDYDILDVTKTRWHEDYGQGFKEMVKGIENIYQTTIALTFRHVSTIPDAVEMLENFYQLAKRPAITDYVQKRAAETVYKLFLEEIKEIDSIFEEVWNTEKNYIPMPVSHPEFGGRSIWVYSLIVRIEKSY